MFVYVWKGVAYATEGMIIDVSLENDRKLSVCFHLFGFCSSVSVI